MRKKLYYVATRMDGTSGNDVKWEVGKVTTVGKESGQQQIYASVLVTNCQVAIYPCRLFRVEPVDGYPVSALGFNDAMQLSDAWSVVEELPSTLTLGPQAKELVSLIEKLSRCTMEDFKAIFVEYWNDDKDKKDALSRVQSSCRRGRFSAEYSIWSAAQGVFSDAYTKIGKTNNPLTTSEFDAVSRVISYTFKALVSRDMVDMEDYDALTNIWRKVIGHIHPDDEEVR